MLTLIKDGQVYDPKPLGQTSILLVDGKIGRVGEVDQAALERSGLELQVIDAEGCLVTPGLIDPHEHLLGGSGESGFATQTPEIAFSEVVQGGITTVVGCLGVDTTTKTLPGLLARAKAFNEEGITAFIYSGGYDVPPVTLTGSVRTDMLMVAEVIGAGEVAIADARSTAPTLDQLDRLVRDAYVGGLLSRKCGITHFHVGDEPSRLSLLRSLIDERSIAPALLYPTHVERNEALMLEAIELSRRGVTVDVDTVERDLPHWLKFYMDKGGDLERMTVSSDAALNSPATVLSQLRECILQHRHPLHTVLALATINTANVLKLDAKGRLAPGMDADVLLLDARSLDVRVVIARGRRLVEDGHLRQHETFLHNSNREINLHGQQ